MNPAFDGAKRFIQHAGYFVVFVSFKIEHERVTEYLGKVVDGFLNFFETNRCFSFIADGRLVIIQEEVIRTIIKNCMLFGFAAIVIDEYIPHDGVQPGFDIGAYMVLSLLARARYIVS
jgi:hypothetical protein